MARRGEMLMLSRQHHAALLLARDARHLAIDAPHAQVVAMNQRIAMYWRDEMAAHFRAEEQLLRRHAGALPAQSAMRLLDEHRALAAMCVRAAAADLRIAALHDFGQRLCAHVRFEERECFDALQAAAESASA